MSNHFPGKLGKVLKKAKGNWDSSGAKKKKMRTPNAREMNMSPS